MFLKIFYVWIGPFMRWLLVDEGGSMAEDLEFFVKSRGLVLVLRVLNLLMRAQIKGEIIR